MIKSTLTYYFPSRLGRIMLLALEEVMGKSGINALLNLSSHFHLIDDYPLDDDDKTVSFESISRLQNALVQGYGLQGGRGLALRAGRVFFSNGLHTFGPELGLHDTTFRLQPPDRKLISVLNSLTGFFNQYTDQQIKLEETEQRFLWRIECCPWCWGRKEIEPACHFAVGMLQETLYWVSGGKHYNVVEDSCIAQGAPTCLIGIDCFPMA